MPDKTRPIGEWADHEVTDYLAEIGVPMPATGVKGMGLNPFAAKIWRYSGMVIGYVPVEPNGDPRRRIVGVHGIEPDRALVGKRIKLTMDGFFVHDFPGGGPHRILCEFSGRNQTESEGEELKFAFHLTCAAGQRAAISGKPIFLGLGVGDNGISFSGRTINVRSETDDHILEALSSGAFSGGLSLLASSQPALKPFVSLATGFVQTTLSRNKNAMVQDFNLGLDFDGASSSARLRLGTYIVVQAPPVSWNWDDFAWEPASQTIFGVELGQPLGLNYMTFGVSMFQ